MFIYVSFACHVFFLCCILNLVCIDRERLLGFWDKLNLDLRKRSVLRQLCPLDFGLLCFILSPLFVMLLNHNTQ